MPIVLVDVPTLAVVLVGPVAPQAVQIAIGNLTPGQTLTVTGSAVGQTWTVRGGAEQTVTTERVVLVDVATPINVPITYTVTIETFAFPADPIMVPYTPGRSVLQSLDGRTAFPIAWHDNADPREPRLRSNIIDVAGRPDPVVRYDLSSGESSQMLVRMTGATSDALRSRLRTHGPMLLLRADGSIPGLPLAVYLMITRSPSARFGTTGERIWTLDVIIVGDPEPTTPRASIAVPEDFDAVYAAVTPETFDTEWVGATAEGFDLIDWTTL
jgi:hypothetical protein